MATPEEHMAAYVQALLAANASREAEFEIILAQLGALIEANNKLQTAVGSLVEQLAFLGALQQPDLRGYQQLN